MVSLAILSSDTSGTDQRNQSSLELMRFPAPFGECYGPPPYIAPPPNYYSVPHRPGLSWAPGPSPLMEVASKVPLVTSTLDELDAMLESHEAMRELEAIDRIKYGRYS